LGSYDKRYKPFTVVNQFPSPGMQIKEKSFIKIYVTSEIMKVKTPDLFGLSLKESEKVLQKE